MSNASKKIIVGMSGGVDSSVAAYLLLQQGYNVSGVFMRNWEADDDDEYCSAEQDFADAKAVCTKLGIELTQVNFAKQYWDKVFRYFLDEYQAGRTPNPDILCNKEIKFDAFLSHCQEKGADFIATGHYARIEHNNGQAYLKKACDDQKDQSYFLHALNQYQLNSSLFPLGHLTKPEVRAIAEQQGFINYGKKDSTGICFIGERKFREFLQEYVLAQPGNIITPEGEVIGKHNGLMFYTLGQRQGLNIGGLKNHPDAPWFVAEKRIDENTLVAVQGGEHPLLYQPALCCQAIHWINPDNAAPSKQLSAKIRYRQNDQPCRLDNSDPKNPIVYFDTPQRAITPGQSIVFYDQDVCLGGAVITSALDKQP